MRPRSVTTAPADVKQRESAPDNARHAGPWPPRPVALMHSRQEQADDECDAPAAHPDLEYSSGVAGKRLGVFRAHKTKPMCPPALECGRRPTLGAMPSTVATKKTAGVHGALDSFFQITQRGSTVSQEVR